MHSPTSHFSCTSAAFQFHHLPNGVSLSLHDEWNYDIQIHSELTENWIRSVSQLTSAKMREFGCDRSWHWCTKQRNFSPVFPEFPYFHFPIPLVNRIEYLKSVAKMWTLRAESQNRCLPTPEKYVKCYEKEWFCNAEPLCGERWRNRKLFYTVRIKITKKKYKSFA
jgi:hypothetical protein